MSTLIDFSIFPIGKGESVSPYVDVVTRCFKELKKDCSRIYMSAKVDYRERESNRILSKVKSVGGSI